MSVGSTLDLLAVKHRSARTFASIRVVKHLLSRQTGYVKIVSICRDKAIALDSIDAAADMAASVWCEENHFHKMVKSDTGFVHWIIENSGFLRFAGKDSPLSPALGGPIEPVRGGHARTPDMRKMERGESVAQWLK